MESSWHDSAVQAHVPGSQTVGFRTVILSPRIVHLTVNTAPLCLFASLCRYRDHSSNSSMYWLSLITDRDANELSEDDVDMWLATSRESDARAVDHDTVALALVARDVITAVNADVAGGWRSGDERPFRRPLGVNQEGNVFASPDHMARPSLRSGA